MPNDREKSVLKYLKDAIGSILVIILEISQTLKMIIIGKSHFFLPSESELRTRTHLLLPECCIRAI